MKRFLVILLVIGMISALAVGSAASLTVTGGQIQYGEDLDLVGDEDGVNVAGWGLETSDGLVYFVRIHNIDTGCEGNDMFVSITDINGDELTNGSITIPADTNSAPDNDPDTGDIGVKINFDTPVPAVDIYDIHVFIEGPHND